MHLLFMTASNSLTWSGLIRIKKLDVLSNIVFVRKSHYVDCLIKELGIDNLLGNPTYTPTTLTTEEILDNHRSVLCSFEISTKDE
jgi:hypothetical protein